MRIKILAFFVAIQLVSFGLWQTLHGEKMTETQPASETTHAAAMAPFSYVHFSARNRSDSSLANLQEGLETRIFEVFGRLPESHVRSVENVILDYDPQAHRGLGGRQIVILRADMEPRELVGVLVHELAHNVDLIALESSQTQRASGFKDGDQAIFIGDPSVDFYRISWETEIVRKRTASNLDFVSGYAMTDAFEDFAETYAYYVLHGNEFKAKVATSPALYAKWRFMKYHVFDGIEFDTGDGVVNAESRPWDVTVLPYDLMAFLAQ
ncbi:MAG: putative zinc-binding metallopeptidase [Candidatus Peregrinibacteria bacterium]